MNQTDQMAKFRKIINESFEEGSSVCNQTAEGTECAVHGLEECGVMENNEVKLNEAAKAPSPEKVKKAAEKIWKKYSSPKNEQRLYANDLHDLVDVASGGRTHLFTSEIENVSGIKTIMASVNGKKPNRERFDKGVDALIKSAARLRMDESHQAPDKFSPELQALMKEYGVNAMDETTDDSEAKKVELDAFKEDVHITVDGDEAQDLIARLTQLAGNAEQAADAALSAADTAQDATDTALDITDTALDATNTALGAAELALDEPAIGADDQHYVCDDCGSSLDVCACDIDSCPVCHQAPCCCDEHNDMTVTTHGLVDSAEFEEADYGHEPSPGTGEPVDTDTYMYKGPQLAQRLVKGVMGDNPIAESSMDRFVKLANAYAEFLSESDIPNEDGQSSPLTAADRENFDRDPFAGETVKDDGSMSPMSQVKRQDVMK